MPLRPLDFAARQIADALSRGPWERQAIVERVRRSLGAELVDARRFANRLLFLHDGIRAPGRDRLAESILNDPQIQDFLQGNDYRPFPVRIDLDPAVMQPRQGLLSLVRVPELTTLGDLADWLHLDPEYLDWFTDAQNRQHRASAEALRHYRYRWLPRRGRSPRLLEMPKCRLKGLQRRILDQILSRVPVHQAAHGFRPRHSCLSHVQAHLGQPAVLHMDLRDFFPSLGIGRVMGLFLALGYPQSVAAALARLCTHRTSEAFLCRSPELAHEERQRLRQRHLPQGAPSSPALSNLLAFRLDCRLQGLARRFGLDYSRYADDLALSGGGYLSRHVQEIQALVGAIAADEGLAVNYRKTRLMTRGRRQRLVGILVNRRPNPTRADYDRLKALLFNCVRHGPDSQNRAGVADFRAHLVGRIAHVNALNPKRGARLEELFARIDWDLP